MTHQDHAIVGLHHALKGRNEKAEKSFLEAERLAQAAGDTKAAGEYAISAQQQTDAIRRKA
jgi:hypothetical protein